MGFTDLTGLRVVAGTDIDGEVRAPETAVPINVGTDGVWKSLSAVTDLQHLSFSTALGDQNVRSFAAILRMSAMSGASISDLVSSIGAFITEHVNAAFAGAASDDPSEAVEEFMRISRIADLAKGQPIAPVVKAMNDYKMPVGSRGGVDLARDMRILMDAERCGMTLRSVADAIDPGLD